MKLDIKDLKSERQWRSATGYNQERFEKLLVLFDDKYQEMHQGSMEEIKAKSPMESVIKDCEELLLFTLFSLKSGLTYDALGFVTGMDGSSAKRNQELGIQILKEVFREEGLAPKREFSTVSEFREHFKDCETLIIDGTEQPTERPKEKTRQKQNYSGKKKPTPLNRRSLRARTKRSGM